MLTGTDSWGEKGFAQSPLWATQARPPRLQSPGPPRQPIASVSTLVCDLMGWNCSRSPPEASHGDRPGPRATSVPLSAHPALVTTPPQPLFPSLAPIQSLFSPSGSSLPHLRAITTSSPQFQPCTITHTHTASLPALLPPAQTIIIGNALQAQTKKDSIPCRLFPSPRW